ncbi:MAG: Uma2 family endonuclease [Chloroflexi bacterium]|nr:Uma2 family endonuclease [Chloroflexota bacterium]
MAVRQAIPGKVEDRALPRRPPAAPSLENGDRLTRAEFERRYEAMPHIKKAELIEGEVHMPSPVHHESHGRPHSDVITWLGTYRAATPGVDLSDNATLRLDLDNEPQPDALLRLDPAAGGHSRIADDDYVEGAPELVVEIAASSASIDLHGKLNAYRRNGVQEYLVWQTYDRQVGWFELQEGIYSPLAPQEGEPGVLRSRVFPGLWLDVSALLADNLAGVLAGLRRGLESAEHAAFVKRLTPGT